MKKVILLVVMLFASMASLYGQEAYKPILTEGRSWVIVTTNMATDEAQVSHIKVDGDTVIDGHSCRILVHENIDTGKIGKTALLEKDRILYEYSESGKDFVPRMDFNMHEGDVLTGGLSVISEDYVDVNGIAYRRLGIGNPGDAPVVYWVEGIGSSEDLWLPEFVCCSVYTHMQECRENGTCVFTEADFSKEGTGVASTPHGLFMWKGRIDSAISSVSAQFRYTPIRITPTEERGTVLITNLTPKDCYVREADQNDGDIHWNSFRANVNEADNTLTIESGQPVGVMADWIEPGEFPPYVEAITRGEGPDVIIRQSGIKGDIEADGSVRFDDGCFLGFGNESVQTYEDMMMLSTYSRPNSFEPVVEVVPDMGDYDYVGEATFTDGWFNPRLRALGKDAVQDVKVPLWRSRDDSDMLLLQNPYSDARWIESGLQKGDGEGSILLDVSDTGFVKVVPGIKCGMRTEVNENGRPVDFYPLTYHQWSLLRGEGAMTPKGDPSTLSGDVITIKGAVFGIGEVPIYGDIWVDAPSINNAWIVLPKGWSGTDNIEADPASAPCYYNLQGVRLPQAVKGQPMIEVKNGHARKVMK